MSSERRNCSLPSHNYAADFLKSPSAQTSKGVLASYLGRAAILSVGFLLTRSGLRRSARFALIGSAAIEAYVLLEVAEMISDGRCN